MMGVLRFGGAVVVQAFGSDFVRGSAGPTWGSMPNAIAHKFSPGIPYLSPLVELVSLGNFLTKFFNEDCRNFRSCLTDRE